MDKRLHQAAGQRDDGVLRADRFEQITQGVIDRRRDHGHERLVDAAQRLIDAAQQFRAKSCGKRRARFVEQGAHGFETEPVQGRACVRAKAAAP